MNKVMLIGNVGKDPDVRYYEADQAVAQVSLATTERGYTLQNGTLAQSCLLSQLSQNCRKIRQEGRQVVYRRANTLPFV